MITEYSSPDKPFFVRSVECHLQDEAIEWYIISIFLLHHIFMCPNVFFVNVLIWKHGDKNVSSKRTNYFLQIHTFLVERLDKYFLRTYF